MHGTMPKRVVVCQGIEETHRLALELAVSHEAAPALYLLGDLGAGKTTFTKSVAGHFDIPTHRVVSPTFSLVNRYGSGRRLVYHLDLYRIENPRELDELGIEEMEEEGALLVVEWAEKLARYWRPDAMVVHFERLVGSDARTRETDEAPRRLTIGAAGPLASWNPERIT